MFRAAMIAVLLTLAIGQNSRLVCQVLCDSHMVSVAACAHETTDATTVGIDTTCTVGVNAVTAFIREDGRRGSTAADPVPALTTAAFQLSRLARSERPSLATARTLRSTAPLITALRI
jgi:hypothetical protein